MKLVLLGSVAAALLVVGCSAAEPSAQLSDSDRHVEEATAPLTVAELNGKRVQIPGDPAIYMIDRGVRRHITDPDTYNRLFRDWNGVVQGEWTATIDTGAPLGADASLAIRPSDGAVFLLESGIKRHVASPAAMDRYYFSWNAVKQIPDWVLDRVPTGDTIE